MTSTKVEKLAPYFRGLTDKTRLMIYLLSTGELSFEQLTNLKVSQLKRWESLLKKDFPELLEISQEIRALREDDAIAFIYPSGRAYSVSNVKDILIRAHQIADKKYTTRDNFVKQIL